MRRLPGLFEESDFVMWKNDKIGELKAINLNNEFWFIGKYLANALGYRDASVITKSVSESNKTALLCRQSGSNYKTIITLVNEPGLYELCFQSKKESARQLLQWISSDVLPSIRAHGIYVKDPEINPLLTEAGRKTILDEISSKAEYRELISAFECASGACSVGTLAKMLKQKGYDIGRNRLFDWLRANKYLSVQKNSYNMPLEKMIDAGYFQVNVPKMQTYVASNPTRLAYVPMITPSGQLHIIHKFSEWYEYNQQHKTDISADPIEEFEKNRIESIKNGFSRLTPKNNGKFYKFLMTYSAS